MSKRLNSSKLRNLVLETLAEVKAEERKNSRSNQLKTIAERARRILEDADPTKVSAERFPLKLSDAAKLAGDQAEVLATGGDDDGEKPDDIVQAKAGTMPVTVLLPSQSSMDIEKAVIFCIAAIRKVKPFKDGPGGDLGAIITSDNHIMDGHHRWIASGMVDPTVDVGGYIVDFPAKQMIAALNMITVNIGITKGKEGSGGFEQFNEAGILAQLEKFAVKAPWSADGEPQKVIEACETFTGEKGAAAIKAAAKKMGTNVAKLTLSVPKGFPERPDMPVISKSKGHLKLAIDLLKSGQVDLNEPYAKEEAAPKKSEEAEVTEESSKNSGELILERWHKLAGLLK
jgi:hypothetical protein